MGGIALPGGNMDSIAARRWRSAAAALRNPCCPWTSVTGQTVSRAFEARILSQRGEDEQVVAGADAVFLQSSPDSDWKARGARESVA